MASKVLSFLQMFRKGLIKPGRLVKCVEDVTFFGEGRQVIFRKGRPYRVLYADHPKELILKAEDGVGIIVSTPTPGRRSTVSWTSFETFAK
jgi:hypothetical protein